MSTETAAADAAAPAKKSKAKLLVIGLVVVGLAAGGWWFMLRPASAETEPVPGEVVPLEAIQVNLADGHYLRLGLALQAVEGAHEVDGSKALDTAIALFSGQSQADLTQPVYRTKLKKQLVHRLDEAYHGEILDVYFTDFVTQ